MDCEGCPVTPFFLSSCVLVKCGRRKTLLSDSDPFSDCVIARYFNRTLWLPTSCLFCANVTTFRSCLARVSSFRCFPPIFLLRFNKYFMFFSNARAKTGFSRFRGVKDEVFMLKCTAMIHPTSQDGFRVGLNRFSASRLFLSFRVCEHSYLTDWSDVGVGTRIAVLFGAFPSSSVISLLRSFKCFSWNRAASVSISAFIFLKKSNDRIPMKMDEQEWKTKIMNFNDDRCQRKVLKNNLHLIDY